MGHLELSASGEGMGLPKEYWPCPLTIITLMEVYSQGKIHSRAAFEALKNSGLVEEREGDIPVRATEMGQAFIQMLLDTPLPEKRWIDPRKTKSQP